MSQAKSGHPIRPAPILWSDDVSDTKKTEPCSTCGETGENAQWNQSCIRRWASKSDEQHMWEWLIDLRWGAHHDNQAPIGPESITLQPFVWRLCGLQSWNGCLVDNPLAHWTRRSVYCLLRAVHAHTRVPHTESGGLLLFSPSTSAIMHIHTQPRTHAHAHVQTHT